MAQAELEAKSESHAQPPLRGSGLKSRAGLLQFFRGDVAELREIVAELAGELGGSAIVGFLVGPGAPRPQ